MKIEILAALAAALTLAGCGINKGQAAATAPPPPAVSVLTVSASDVPIFSDYSAQTYARDMVEVRGRVDGYIEKRLFQVGSDVRAGQPLYILDLRPYQAAVDKSRGDVEQAKANADFAAKQVALIQAEADLAQAKANLAKAQQDVARLQPLVKEEAASKEDLDNAIAALRANEANVRAREANVQQTRLSTKNQLEASKAQVESNQALLRTSELDLEYATIHAPISGRIGDTLVQVGGLVSRGAQTPLTTIVPLDPIWVRYQVSETEYLEFTRRYGNPIAKVPLELVLADGSTHPFKGRVENTTNQIDSRTGTLELQATFPNPQHTILPGQFGRVRVQVEKRSNAILVPQRSVTELQGQQAVMTVGADNKVQPRGITTGERVGEQWIVLQGLKPGERVIVEGLQKARPGSPVTPEPYKPAAATDEKKGI